MRFKSQEHQINGQLGEAFQLRHPTQIHDGVGLAMGNQGRFEQEIWNIPGPE